MPRYGLPLCRTPAIVASNTAHKKKPATKPIAKSMFMYIVVSLYKAIAGVTRHIELRKIHRHLVTYRPF